MQIISLLKAILTQDMNLFKYKTKSNSSKLKKLILPIILFIIISFSIGSLLFSFFEELAKYHLSYVMLSLILFFLAIFTLIEGVFKSQSILFDCKDNELLFSLPIKRRTIIFIRIIKLLIFEYLLNFMFLLPTYVIYIYFEHPGISFYFLSILMIILLPIIPTIIACFIGYIIKLVASKMKFKRLIQVILTTSFVLVYLYFSMNMDSFMESIVKNATSINDIINKIYYPVGIYISLIDKFDILKFIILLLINVIPFLLFILIGQLFYFKIISDSNNKKVKKRNKEIIIKQKSSLMALTKKELKRYTSSAVFMFNTSFGLIIGLIFTIVLCLKGKSMIVKMLSNYGVSDNVGLNILFYGILLFTLCSTSISSSSISLEGRTINITKSLPIDYKDIFKSKILMCFIIEVPFALVSSLLFIIFHKVSIIFILELFLLIFMIIIFNSTVGLLINLKYPKLNCNNDTEVVKQSMSSLISTLIGFVSFIITIVLIVICNNYFNLFIIVGVHLFLLFIVNIILYSLLMKKGPTAYQKLNV